MDLARARGAAAVAAPNEEDAAAGGGGAETTAAAAHAAAATAAATAAAATRRLSPDGVAHHRACSAWAPPLRVLAAVGAAALQSALNAAAARPRPLQQQEATSGDGVNPPTCLAPLDPTPSLARHWATAVAHAVANQASLAAARVASQYAVAKAHHGDTVEKALEKAHHADRAAVTPPTASPGSSLGLQPGACGSQGGHVGGSDTEAFWLTDARRAACVEVSALLDGGLALLHAHSLGGQMGGAGAAAASAGAAASAAAGTGGADSNETVALEDGTPDSGVAWAVVLGWGELSAVEAALARGAAHVVAAAAHGERACEGTAAAAVAAAAGDSAPAAAATAADAAALFAVRLAAGARAVLDQHLATAAGGDFL
jgi:hypothetical protein